MVSSEAMALRTPDDDEYGSPMPAYLRFLTVEEWQEGSVRLGRVDEFGDPAEIADFARMLMAEVGHAHEHLHDLDGNPTSEAPVQATETPAEPEPKQASAPTFASPDTLYRALAEVLGDETAVTGQLDVSQFMALVGRVVEAVSP